MKRNKRGVSLLIAFAAFAALPTVVHADKPKPPKLEAVPYQFIGTAEQCGGAAGTAGAVTGQWLPGVGDPAGFALWLSKNAPTSDCSAAGADLTAVNNKVLTELAFEYKGYCGAGSPRFNVYTTSGVYYFFGCSAGVHTPAGNGFTHVEFRNVDAYPSDGVTAFPGFGNTTVTGIEIVADEQGSTLIDNISFNSSIITSPNAALANNLCKK